MTLSFLAARATVLQVVASQTACEAVPLAASFGRVLAQDVLADRDMPPLDRSVRDGFAVRTQDLPGPLPVMGVVRAGDPLCALAPGQALEIMTGAPIPEGADAVLMVEQAERSQNGVTHAPVAPGTYISRRAEEAAAGATLLTSGTRVTPSHIAVLALCGHSQIAVFRKPRVAILATGDELVSVEQAPLPHQVRNSNAVALAAQVERAGGVPIFLPIAPDERSRTVTLIEEGLSADMLLLSGGVSAGKFDFVEEALAALGAKFHFDRVLIQPGAPVVFGEVGRTPFFGLPGNPASTYVTFEIFARAALDLLSGIAEPALRTGLALLTEPFHHKPGITRFLPATVSAAGNLTPVRWRGSSDIAAVARANAFLIADAEREQWRTGELMPFLMQ